jgi:hypothetical protein
MRRVPAAPRVKVFGHRWEYEELVEMIDRPQTGEGDRCVTR